MRILPLFFRALVFRALAGFARAAPAGLLALALFWATAAAAAAEEPMSAEPNAAAVPRGFASDEELVAAGARIGNVEIVIGDIFDVADPREDRWLFRLANRLHPTTRPWVVRAQALFEVGDPYDPRILAETERILRATGNFYDVTVLPVAYDEATGLVDIEIRARDVWTLTGGIKFSRGGGENSSGFKIRDDNFFGTGKSVQLESSENVDREIRLVRVFDPNVLGSRWRAKIQAEQNSDGDVWDLELGRPFYSLDSRTGFYVRALKEERIDPHYELGKVRVRFRHEIEFLEAYYGWSKGLKNGRALRWLAGFTTRHHDFSRAPTPQPAAFIPEDRKLVYPWIGFSSVADQFAEITDFDQINKTEDVSLGVTVDGSLGYSSESLGADRNAVIWSLRTYGGFRWSERQTGRFDVGFSGRATGDGAENVLAAGEMRYYLRNFGDNLFYALLRGEWSRDLDQDRQILLGGDNGLRGYPLRYQSGEKLFLLTLEQRIFTNWYPFRLVYVGGAAFIDIGRTWNDDPFARNQGWLRDAGFGLRLSSSRSGLGSVVHLDVAFPLDGDPSIENVQWLVSTKNTF
jgi:hypothetical protein